MTKGVDASSLFNAQFHIINKVVRSANSAIVTTVLFNFFCHGLL